MKKKQKKHRNTQRQVAQAQPIVRVLKMIMIQAYTEL